MILPEEDAAEQAALVGDDGDVFGELEGDFFGVAAAQVEVVPVEEHFGLLDGGFEELVPAGLAVLVEAAAAEGVLVVHALLAPGMEAQLQAGDEVAIGKEGAAQAGTQGEHQLDAPALDDSVAGDVGVVAHTDGLAPTLGELVLEGEVAPVGMEVDGEDGDAALDDAGKANGDAVEVRKWGAEFIESGEYDLGRGHGRRDDAQPLADGVAGGIE